MLPTKDDLKALDTVKKLLAKANDPASSEEESMAFMAKAQELLVKNNLDLKDLEKLNQDEDPKVVEFEWAPKYANHAWRKVLANSTAKLYMCKLLLGRTYDTKKFDYVPSYVLVGRQSSIDVAKAMIDFMFATGVHMSKNYGATLRKQTGVGIPDKVRHQFEEGYGLRMADRIDGMTFASRKPQVGDGSGLPALYNSEEKAVDEFLANKKLGKAKSVRLHGYNPHAHKGAAAANNVSLDSQGVKPVKGAMLLSGPKG